MSTSLVTTEINHRHGSLAKVIMLYDYYERLKKINPSAIGATLPFYWTANKTRSLFALKANVGSYHVENNHVQGSASYAFWSKTTLRFWASHIWLSDKSIFWFIQFRHLLPHYKILIIWWFLRSLETKGLLTI